MPESRTRRPIPALLCLVALLLLTGIVWWRVLQRHEDASATGPKQTSTSSRTSASATCAAVPVVLPKPTEVKVNVYNGSGRDGLALATKSELERRGFRVPLIDTASTRVSGVAQIQYGPSGTLGAKLVQIYLPGSKLARSTRADSTVDVVLGSGFSSLATAAQVNAAVAAAARGC